MKTIRINDITIREWEKTNGNLSFREKVEAVKIMDRLNYSEISLPALTEDKASELLVKTIAQTVANAEVSILAGLTEKEIERTWKTIEKAAKPALVIAVPVSPVQMEYICGKKGDKILELITDLVGKAKKLCERVEFEALDATRAEEDFLMNAVKSAVAAGATKVTVCDSAGIMLPDEIKGLFERIINKVPEVSDIILSASLSNSLDLSTCSAFSALTAGASEIAVTIDGGSFPGVRRMVNLIRAKGSDLGMETSILKTELSRDIEKIDDIISRGKNVKTEKTEKADEDQERFTAADSIELIGEACEKYGYALSDEDLAAVYEAFKRVASRKESVGNRELEAIIASTALQVPPTYTLKSYVINSGNIISASANIVIVQNGNELPGISAGDGPIDAAFRAIETILGHHYELDDFQIQSVTEGREAMGRAVVKLRVQGRLYSGTGISTDIIGASIRAYLNAVNKAVYSYGQ